jgi:hypothetical protein
VLIRALANDMLILSFDAIWMKTFYSIVWNLMIEKKDTNKFVMLWLPRKRYGGLKLRNVRRDWQSGT